LAKTAQKVDDEKNESNFHSVNQQYEKLETESITSLQPMQTSTKF